MLTRQQIKELADTDSCQEMFKEKVESLRQDLEKAQKRRKDCLIALRELTDSQQWFEDVALEMWDKEIKKISSEIGRFKRLIKTDSSYDFQQKIDEAKQVPIDELYNFEKPRISANRISAVCPFHAEKTPSFVVYRDSNSWYCFGACGSGGDAISFIQKLHDCSFKEAIDKLVN